MIFNFDKTRYYTDKDYNCPHCGWEMDYDKVKHDPNNQYGYICPQCGGSFETPDV